MFTKPLSVKYLAINGCPVSKLIGNSRRAIDVAVAMFSQKTGVSGVVGGVEQSVNGLRSSLMQRPS